jgi:polyprenyl-phospho-N-acetylgalactosaminyl synthase
MHADTYVIVPVYNEAPVLDEVLSGLTKRFKHIICIDDGSTDGSSEIIKESGATLLQHRRNKGQGAAFRTGFKYALGQTNARYLITFDADGQHQVEDAEAMLTHIKKHKLSVVLGSRFLGAAPGMGIVKRLTLRLAIRFTHLFTNLPLTDTHNGLRIFRRDFAEKLTFKLNGMAYASEMELAVAQLKVAYEEFPVTIIYSDYAKSKGQSVFNSFAIVWELMTQKLRDHYSEG